MTRPKGIPAWNKGLKLTETWKKNLSLSHKGKSSWNGRKHSDEAKIKMSIAKKGKVPFNKTYPNDPIKQKQFVNWGKNRRNSIIKRLRIESQSHTFGEWELLKKQYGYTCPCCRKSEQEIKLTEDHIIPLSKGGSDVIENIQPLCLRCNLVKSSKIIRY